jgi:ubiquinone/menaquinone biosynthesis C-methylase UbiE
LLLTVAQTVIHGSTVPLREANAEIDEADRVSRTWELKAPAGPLGGDRFHILLADGLAPPFTGAAFDTVVTPWFIDLVPPDLEQFVPVLARLVKPGGRWVNLEPLRCTPATPVGRRYTREEVFDLAGRAGFRMGKWQAESMPHLVSKLSRRGKVAWVLAFAATRP